MWNTNLGRDKVEGDFCVDFCVVSLQQACDLVSLIVHHSYVRFGQQVYCQTTGIPMGVNPGVNLANFYLYIRHGPGTARQGSRLHTCCFRMHFSVFVQTRRAGPVVASLTAIIETGAPTL